MDLKNIHIGALIKQKVGESGIDTARICNFLQCTEQEIEEMFASRGINTEIILRWSKLLKYDFFRLYTQHLILFAPADKDGTDLLKKNYTGLPQFRKNIYTREVIAFILELVHTGKKTKFEIIEEYHIPKTTLYKWIQKYPEFSVQKQTEI